MSKHKLVFLGEQGSGKTSIITRFMYDSFDTSYQATIGIDFLAKTVKVGDNTIKLQLWDTAGQERFRSLIPSYIRDSSGAIVIYDVTNRHSFDGIDQWMQDVKNDGDENIITAIVGNKCDFQAERAVLYEEGQKKAEQYSSVFFETSAKEGTNIKELFNTICLLLPKDDTQNNDNVPIELSYELTEKQSSKFGFCNC